MSVETLVARAAEAEANLDLVKALDTYEDALKSMGDAVMMAFPRADAATAALVALHERFPAGAAALGLEPLPLHSGAHFGEVVETRDGDLYGQTVNIAARVQGGAETGSIMVSEAFVAASGGSPERFRPLGTRSFKNVPDPVACFALIPAEAPSLPQAAFGSPLASPS